MLVVADASPINVLIRIECAWVLGELFGTVVIPPEVYAELTHSHTPSVVHTFVSSSPPWLRVQVATCERPLPHLDSGEAAAINLACDLNFATILIDDRDGRRAAQRLGLKVFGTLGVLEMASRQKLIRLPIAAEKLAQTDFRIDPAMVQEALRRDNNRPAGM